MVHHRSIICRNSLWDIHLKLMSLIGHVRRGWISLTASQNSPRKRLFFDPRPKFTPELPDDYWPQICSLPTTFPGKAQSRDDAFICCKIMTYWELVWCHWKNRVCAALCPNILCHWWVAFTKPTVLHRDLVNIYFGDIIGYVCERLGDAGIFYDANYERQRRTNY